MQSPTNEKIYTICLEELKDEKNIYPGHFTYPESLEFSIGNKVLKGSNLRNLKYVLRSIRKSLRINIRGLSKKQREDIKERRLESQIKLNKHLTKLKEVRNAKNI